MTGRIDWDRWRQGWPGSKPVGNQVEGPCSVTGKGKDCQHVNLRNPLAGCRHCSADGSGGLTGDQLVEHARAAGALRDDIDLGRAGGAWESWTWQTADGRERRQYRAPDGKKWQTKDPPAGGWPAPAALLYCPAGVPAAPGPIYVCEGASDADAVLELGLPAIGRNNAHQSAASLARLDRDAVYRVWPDVDVDDDQAGYKQATYWHDALTGAGLRVELIDPLKLRPDAPAGYDARDWCESLPAGTTADDAGAMLAAAVVDLDTIKGRLPGTAVLTAGAPAAAAVEPDRLAISEAELADLFAAEHGTNHAHRPGLGWLLWTGTEWQYERHDEIIGELMSFGRHRWGRLAADGQIKSDEKTGGRHSTARGTEVKLRSRLAADDWDTDPYVIGLPAGRLAELGTGATRDRTRADRITRTAGAVPAYIVGPNRWLQFLNEALPVDAHDWLQAVIGYAATGHTREHLLLFIYGRTGTGKGTFLTAVGNAFGEYCRRIDPDDLMERSGNQHPAWLADLAGRRAVIGDELKRGRKWATARTKSLVSGEPIRARLMHKDFFEFRPSAQIILAANHAPNLPSRDTGLTRRLRVLPFTNKPARHDPYLESEIHPGAVMAWILTGARRYIAHGLPATPASVIAATGFYHATADQLAPFVATLPRGEWIKRSDIGRLYTDWTASNGERNPLKIPVVLSTLREDYDAEERQMSAGWEMKLPAPVGCTGDTGDIDSPFCPSRVRVRKEPENGVTDITGVTNLPAGLRPFEGADIVHMAAGDGVAVESIDASGTARMHAPRSIRVLKRAADGAVAVAEDPDLPIPAGWSVHWPADDATDDDEPAPPVRF